MSTDPSDSSDSSDQLTLQKVRERLANLIQGGFELSTTALIEALPVTGKSYGVIQWASRTNEPLTVFAPRHDLLTEYEEYCEEFGLDYWRIPSLMYDCESFERDDNNQYQTVDEAARGLLKEYKQGLDGESLHAKHSNLSCQTEGECPYIAKRNHTPANDAVLLGTYRLSKSETYIQDRYVAFDEFPGFDFLKTFEDGIAPIISAYVKDDNNNLPFSDYTELVEQKHNEQDSIETWKEGLSPYPQDRQHVQHNSDTSAHSLAPIVTLAPLEMERLDNGWRYADLGYGRIAVRNPKANKWTFLLPPDLSSAKSVIGLDGTPNRRLWATALSETIVKLSLLNKNEPQTYIQDVLNYQFVKTTKNWKAIQSGEGASPPKDLALIEEIAQREKQDPALISSQKALRQYDQNGLDELTDTTEHYNNLKGINKFAKERLGIIAGNPQPSDAVIEKWAALAGESAQRRESTSGKETDFGGFGNSVWRTFVHDEVLQAAMRFGRDRTDGQQSTMVYIHTTAIPLWVPVEGDVPNIQSWITEGEGMHGMRDTINAIQTLDKWRDREWKATELYERTGVTNKTVRDRLDNLDQQGYIECCGKKGQGGALHYVDVCLDGAGRFGHVQFDQ